MKILKIPNLNETQKRLFEILKGSHAKYTNGTRTAIIPMHDTVARGTLKSILIQANIEIEEFLELL